MAEHELTQATLWPVKWHVLCLRWQGSLDHQGEALQITYKSQVCLTDALGPKLNELRSTGLETVRSVNHGGQTGSLHQDVY